jgi:uncharacterized DUF497 family protein
MADHEFRDDGSVVVFLWHVQKAETNLKKHGVNFDEAKTVFDDPLAMIFDDPLHSIDERREIVIGHSVEGRLLIVCFTETSHEHIRIFSARPATNKERRDYEQQHAKS